MLATYCFVCVRWRLSAKAKKTWLFFILTVVVVAPFMSPLPLNVFWRPWSQTVLLVCGFAFFMTVLNTAFWWSEWSGRREMEKEAKNDTKPSIDILE